HGQGGLDLQRPGKVHPAADLLAGGRHHGGEGGRPAPDLFWRLFPRPGHAGAVLCARFATQIVLISGSARARGVADLSPLEVIGMWCRPALFCLLGLPALLMVLSGSLGQDLPPGIQDGKEQPGKKPGQPKVPTPTTVEQSFPSKGPMETAWKVEWETK